MLIFIRVDIIFILNSCNAQCRWLQKWQVNPTCGNITLVLRTFLLIQIWNIHEMLTFNQQMTNKMAHRITSTCDATYAVITHSHHIFTVPASFLQSFEDWSLQLFPSPTSSSTIELISVIIGHFNHRCYLLTRSATVNYTEKPFRAKQCYRFWITVDIFNPRRQHKCSVQAASKGKWT